MRKPKPPRPHIRLTKDLVVLTAVGQPRTLCIKHNARLLVVALVELADNLRRKWPLIEGGERQLADALRGRVADPARYVESLASRLRRRRKLTLLDRYAIGIYLLGEATVQLHLPPR